MKKLLIILPLLILVILAFKPIEGLLYANFTEEANGLIAYYPFNGNANDESGNNNNLTNSGSSLTSDRNSNPNSAYSFNGSVYLYKDDSEILSLNNDLSFSCWFYCTNNSTTQRVFSISNGSALGEISLRLRSTDLNVQMHQLNGIVSNALITMSVQNNTWYHVVGIKDDNNIYIYLNGNYGNQDTHTNMFGAGNFNYTRIGNLYYASASIQYFSGIIDDIRVYNRVLTTDEITALYNE